MQEFFLRATLGFYWKEIMLGGVEPESWEYLKVYEGSRKNFFLVVWPVKTLGVWPVKKELFFRLT